MGDYDNMHVIDRDVEFDFTYANLLLFSFKNTKERLERQRQERAELITTAKHEFKGRFSRIFSNNSQTATKEYNNLITALGDAAEDMQKYIDAAHQENENRKKFREAMANWEEEKRKIREKIQEDNAYKVPSLHQNPSDHYPPQPELHVDNDGPTFEVRSSIIESRNPEETRTKGRNRTHRYQAQAKQNAEDAAETTSAIPGNLLKFAEGTTELDRVIAGDHYASTGVYKGFRENTTWGELEATGLWNSLAQWLQANQFDVKWITSIAEAFAQAGSQGALGPIYSTAQFMDNPQYVNTGYIQNYLTAHKVDVHRPTIDVHRATVTGALYSSGYALDPVNVATGNFIEHERDLSFEHAPSASLLNIERMYNSVAVTRPTEVPSGVFGLGWSSTIDTCIAFNEGGAQWHTIDGRIITFPRSGDGFGRAPSEAYWLTKVFPGDELYNHVLATTEKATKQIDSTNRDTTSPAYYWVVYNSKHTRYFYDPSGVWAGSIEGHYASLVVPLYSDNFAAGTSLLEDIIHPVSGRGIHISYEQAPQSSGARPVGAYTYVVTKKYSTHILDAITYRYNQNGLLVAVERPDGTRRYIHNAEYLLEEVWDVNGHREVTNNYDDQGRVVHQITDYGREVSYVYAPGIMTIIADAKTGENSNVWCSDERGRLISMVATDGARQTMRYDTFGNRISITERDGSTTNRAYDDRSRLIKQLTPEGALSKYTWDEHDRLLSTSVHDFRDRRKPSDPIVVSYTYEPTGMNPNPTSMTDGNGNTTHYEWDAHGNLASVTDPTGVSIAYLYNESQDLVGITNSAGDTVHLEYDAHGRVTQVKDALGRVTSIGWNSAGQLSSITDAAGARWSLTYPERSSEMPAFIRQDSETVDSSYRQNKAWPSGHLPSALTDPYGHVTRFEYNNGNQLTAVTDPLGRTKRAVFDSWGNVVKTINALGATTKYEYDGLSQLIAVTDPLGARNEFEYDLAGEITQITDATGVMTHHSKDRKTGEETASVTGMFGSSFRQLDYLGRVTIEGKETPKGSTRSLPVVGSSQGPDPLPKHNSVADFITYDAAGNPVEVLDSNGGLTQRTYDAANRLTLEISPAGRFRTFEYDHVGRLWRMGVGLSIPEQKPSVDSSSAEWEEPTAWAYTTLTYDAASQVIARTYPDGMTEHITYDSLGRVVRVQHGAHTATYAYDRCSRLTYMSDNRSGTRRFIYDAAGQLITAVDALGYRTHFKYDDAGQMVRTVDATGQVTEYIYDAAGQLIRAIKGVGSQHELVSTYTYDPAGRLRSENNGVRTHSYSYDYQAGGLLKSRCVDGVQAAEYLYSADGTTADGQTIVVRDYASAKALKALGDSTEPYIEHRFVYDASGNLISRTRSNMLPNGELCEDSAPSTGLVQEHVQALNTFTATGAYTLTYSYDADGYLISSVTPYSRSAHTVDGAGRTVAVKSTATNQSAHAPTSSVFTYDPIGRLTRAQVGDVVSSWAHDHVTGLISEYSRELTVDGSTSCSAIQRLEHTQVIRDRNGRVVGLDSVGPETSSEGLVLYSYDDAGQLVGARSKTQVWEWEYTAGVMVLERVFTFKTSDAAKLSSADSRILTGERIFTHNTANQLVAIETREYDPSQESAAVAAHSITEYIYNLAGERVSEVTTDKLTDAVYSREYSWGPYGGLASVADSGSSRTDSSRISVVSDALGEVSAVSDSNGLTVPVIWDSRSHIPRLLGAGAISVPGSDGGFSQAGIPGSLIPWRTIDTYSAPDTRADYHVFNAPGGSSHSAGLGKAELLPAGFEFTGAGSLRISGVDILGARAYDSASHRFLSTDPLTAVIGSSWFADVYAYAANNPLEYVDPRGERPMTQEEHRGYKDDEGRRFMQQGLRTLAVGATLVSVFIPPASIAGAVIAGGVAGASFAGADAMDTRRPDGSVDWDNFSIQTAGGGVEGAVLAGAWGGVFKYGPRVVNSFGARLNNVPVVARTIERGSQLPVVQNTQLAITKTTARIDGFRDRLTNWVYTRALGVDNYAPHPHQFTGLHPAANAPHLTPAAHGHVVPEMAERGIPNGGGTYSKGFNHAPQADDYLKSRINWEGLKGKRVKYPDKPNIQYVDNLKKLNKEVRKYRTAQAQIKAENAEIKEYNKAVRKQAKLDGVEEGSPGYEIKEHKRTPPEPKLRIFRDDFIDSKGEKMVTDYTSGMYGTDPGVNKYLVLRPSEYAGEIPQEVFDMAKEVWTKGGNLHPDVRFKDFNNKLEYRLNADTSEEVTHTYVPLPTRMTNVPKKGDPQEFMDLKYYEATIKIPGEVTAEKFGTHRLVIANNGTMYYTPDHYQTFILIKE